MIRFLLVAVFLLISVERGKSQEQVSKQLKSKISRLKIGDRIPNIVLNNITNYQNGSIKFSDLRGKLIILDFWSVNCISCISSIPEMEKFQKEFENKIQIVLVTKNSPGEIDNLKMKSKIVRELTLPSIVGDKILSSYFFYQTTPTHVWIDSTGIVRYVTGGWNISEKNLEKYFQNIPLDFSVKNDATVFDLKKPLWLEGNGRQGKYLKYYSYIMEYSPSVPGGITRSYDSSTNRLIGISERKVDIETLYMNAFCVGKYADLNNISRVLLKVNQPELLSYPPQANDLLDKWVSLNTYSYEIGVPESKSNDIFNYMQQDIERYFGYKASIENSKVKCLILTSNNSEQNLSETNGKEFYKSYDDNTKFIFRNYPLSKFIRLLIFYNQQEKNKIPIIDEIKYDCTINMEINSSLSNISALKIQLGKYGINISEEDREIPMLTIRDKY